MPNTIADNLSRLVSAKSAIASAIVNMGGSVGVNDGFEAFPAAISAIPAYNFDITQEEWDIIEAINNQTISGRLSLSEVTKIGSMMFCSCNNLTEVVFPVCKTIGHSAFLNCSSLQSVNFPACTTIRASAFLNCSSLQSVNFPACTTIGTSAFVNCSSLQSINFPVCKTIEPSAFAYCSSLSAIYLLTSFVCFLYDSNAFLSTPISLSSYLGYFGSIYVPSSLVASYQTATSWTYYSDRIVGV